MNENNRIWDNIKEIIKNAETTTTTTTTITTPTTTTTAATTTSKITTTTKTTTKRPTTTTTTTTTTTKPKPKSETCEDLVPFYIKKGIYTIKPVPSLGSFKAYCEWGYDQQPYTLILRRRGHTDFYRGWTEYELGFGVLGDDYWMGLEHIHEMTSSEPYSLMVDLIDFEGRRFWAHFDHFVVGPPENDYVLESVGDYTGTAGDSLSHHVGMKFSTKDRKNDIHPTIHCAVSLHGAWWYRRCIGCCLTGIYYDFPKNDHKDGIVWETADGPRYSYRYAEMSIQRNSYH